MYHNGDNTNGMTKKRLIAEYKAGNIDMDDDSLIVHYGGMPWDHSKTPDAAEIELHAAIEFAGGRDAVVKNAINNWINMCIDDGIIHTGSL